ncbi:four helix bundle protein [bacterium]|nr:four helix bundle protein [bacterium]
MKDEKREDRDLRKRTKSYALRVIRLYTSLPKSEVAKVLGKQLLRSGTSVGAHYAEANRAKSDRDFVNKLEGALQELDESHYWLELLSESDTIQAERLVELLKETDELISIFVKMTTTVKKRSEKK